MSTTAEPPSLICEALAAVMGQPLELNEAWLVKLREFFRARGREMPEINKIQAMIPRGAKMIENTCGTAAGISVEGSGIRVRGSGDGDGTGDPGPGTRLCGVFVLPGVPREMMVMFERDVLPVIAKGGGGGVILSRTLHTYGFGESWV
jgi:nicotinamide-nucleotide amidase